MKVEYAEGKPPRGRGKIQDFYDFAGHPTVAGGRVKVVLELLGPNRRPVQVTEDLPGFWERLYPDVKRNSNGAIRDMSGDDVTACHIEINVRQFAFYALFR